MKQPRKILLIICILSTSLVTAAIYFKERGPWKLPKSIKLNKNNFSYVEPRPHIPSSLYHMKNKPDFKKTVSICKEKYSESIQILERSVSIASSKHVDSLAISKTLAERTMVFLEAMAIRELRNEGIKEISPKIIKDKKQEIIDAILFRGFEKTDPSTVSGWVGKDLEVLESLKNDGNIRELLFNWSLLFIKNILSYYWEKGEKGKLAISEIDNIIRTELKKNWSIDIKKLFDKSLKLERFPASGPYGLLNFTKKIRISLKNEDVLSKAVMVAPKESDLVIPLSQRERKYTKFHDSKVSWHVGEAYFESPTYEDNNHPYLLAVKEVGTPVFAGISGTLDMYMTLACVLDLCNYSDLYKVRLASLAELVNSKHHSVVEVLYASKSFGFEFILGPEYYKFIYPMDDSFQENLKTIQASLGFKLPDEILNNCLCEKFRSRKNKCELVSWQPNLSKVYLEKIKKDHTNKYNP